MGPRIPLVARRAEHERRRIIIMVLGDAALAFAPVAGLAVDCLTHIVVARLWRGGPPRKLMIGFAAGLLCTAGACILALAGTEADCADALALASLSLATYAALGFGYWSFINLNITSLRIRLLQEVQEAPDGLPVAALHRYYGTEEMLRRRLVRLLGNGQVVERAGRFYLNKCTLLCIARTIDAARFLILGRITARHAAAGATARAAISTHCGAGLTACAPKQGESACNG
jgi:hypothetical protein